MRVLLDTNVILDVLQNRMPWAKDAVILFRSVAGNLVGGCLTAKQVADLSFFSRKLFRGEENADKKARQVISGLLALFEVIDTLGTDCRNALGIDKGDYEDAMLIAAASREKLDGIVTRNAEHFRDCPVRVFTPAEFAELLKSGTDGEEGEE